MRASGALGILVVHNDPVPEREVWNALGPEHSVVTARFGLNRAVGAEYRGESVEEFLTPQVDQHIRWLIDSGIQAIALCFVSISVVGGANFDADFAEAIEEIYGVYGYTAGTALRSLVRAYDPRDALVVLPPWFTDETVNHTRTYIKGCTEAALKIHRFQLSDSWDTAKRQDLFDRGAKTHISPAALLKQVRASMTAATDLIIVPGSGFATDRAFVGCSSLPPAVTANSAVAEHFRRWHAQTRRGAAAEAEHGCSVRRSRQEPPRVEA